MDNLVKRIFISEKNADGSDRLVNGEATSSVAKKNGMRATHGENDEHQVGYWIWTRPEIDIKGFDTEKFISDTRRAVDGVMRSGVECKKIG